MTEATAGKWSKMNWFEVISAKKQCFDFRGTLSISLAEFFGTGVLVFVACLGASVKEGGYAVPCLVSGLAVMIVLHLFGHISGAHVNPVTTLCALIMGQITIAFVPIYVASQLLGSFCGFGLLKWILPEIYVWKSSTLDANPIGMTLPLIEDSSKESIFLLEFCITLILSFANCASWDPGTETLKDGLALRFGFLVATLNFIAVPYTGCSMNPARSFGPAVWYQDWAIHWIYWVAPLLAGLIGSLIYRYLLLRKVKGV